MTDKQRLVEPVVHECQAQLLFADGTLREPMMPYFAMLSAYEPDLEASFTAAGREWFVGTDDTIPGADAFTDGKRPSVARHWTGKIATRPDDSGEAYIEFQIPVYERGADRYQRRLNLQFRPALPESTHVETGEPIHSLPRELPHGVRVEVQSAYVDPADVTDILRRFADAIGVSSRYFDEECIHPWSRLTDIAFHVRGEKDVVHEALIDRGGVFPRLAQFGPQHRGRGEFSWDNGSAYGKRHAVALDPDARSRLYGEHAAGTLVKSYLPKYASDDDGDEALSQPKVEVQWSQYYTPNEVAVPFLDDHVDDVGDDQVAVSRTDHIDELQGWLLNVLRWGGLDLDPEADVWVADDYFRPAPMDGDRVDRLELVDDPIANVVDHERDLVVNELVANPPTDAERDVLDVISDGGAVPTMADAADEAGVCPATVSRTIRKFQRLVRRAADGYQPATGVVGERITELFRGIQQSIDAAGQGLERIRAGGQTIPEDSAFGRWVDRWGASFVEDGGALKLRLSIGLLSRHEVALVLRNGYQAAQDSVGVRITRLENAVVAYHDRDGQLVDRGEKLVLHRGGRPQILGRYPAR